MKIRISATIEKETKKIIEELMKEGKYRNSSHLIEEAIRKMGGEKHDK
jgi:Arc/MetJ-type ribon-helix-helix transcriptional regulator